MPAVVPPALYQVDYGTRLSGSSDMWWCESARKVWQHRPLPPAGKQNAAVPLQLARNEYEAVQIVARPEKTVQNVVARASDFVGPNGARLAAKNITIDQVEYVGVRQPTDRLGATGYWPDPLPPLKQPITLKAETNQPFWITAFAPKDIPAGVYKGSIQFLGSGWRRKVPLQITVWNFTLPDETHIRSSLSATPERIALYHNVAGKDLETVVDLYHENFARHRISPLDIQYGSHIKIDWGNIVQAAWPGGTLDKTQMYNGSESLRIEDTDTKGAPAILSPRIPVKSGQKYVVKWAARTPVDGQVYRVTVETFDLNEERRVGANADFDITGSTQWTQHSYDISDTLQNADIKSVRVGLRPVRWTESGELTGTAWFDEVQITDDKGEDIFKGGGHFVANKNPVTAEQVKLDFTAFDRATKHAIEKYHITGFRVPVATGLINSLNRYNGGSIAGYPEGSPEYELLFGSYLRQVQEHLEEKGWLDKAYLYWADEPVPALVPQVAETAQKIRSYAPKLKWLLALNYFSTNPLLKPVDIWVPILHQFKPEDATAKQAEGKEVWWYICVDPKAPYVGEFIDHPALEPRMWLWQSWQNKVDGILIWTTVFWNGPVKYPGQRQNPWQDTMSWAGNSPLGNGDGRFLYPPNRDPNNDKRPYIEGPVNSMRWELLRDGIEDYEYFWMLQQQVNQLEARRSLNAAQQAWLTQARDLLIVPANISASLTQHTSDPVVLLKRRSQLAAAISSGAQLVR